MELTTNTSANGETSLDINDIIDIGLFDGTIDSLNEMVAAFTFISPMTWSYKESKDGKIKSVLFFNENKLLMIKEGIKCKKKNAACSVDNGQGWITIKSNDDESISTRITIIDQDTYNIVLGRYMAKELKDCIGDATSKLMDIFEDELD